MAKEPENLTVSILREMRADMKADCARSDEALREVRLKLVAHDLRFDALDERFEIIREGANSAVDYAANAQRAHVDLKKEIDALKRPVEKLEAAH